MRDAGSEYASIAPVKTRAEDWKRRFPKTYKDAWMSHAAPTVFAPFARLELLSWSPLFIPGGGDGPAPPLDGMAWYAELLEYGGALDADDPDGNLVPTLVEKLVAPTVARAAESSWDPASAAQSRRLAGVVKDLLVYLDPNASDVMARVLVVVAKRLLETAETRCDIPGWAPVATSAAAAAAAHVRRHSASRCGARAATAWTGILPAADLAAVVRDAIVVQRVVPHLRLALARPGECPRASSASPLPRRASGSSPRGPSPRRSGRWRARARRRTRRRRRRRTRSARWIQHGSCARSPRSASSTRRRRWPNCSGCP